MKGRLYPKAARTGPYAHAQEVTRVGGRAVVAVARKLVSYAYWMVKRNQTYEELSPWAIA